MAHYALLDSSGVVQQVFVGRDENSDGVDWERYYAESAGLPNGRVRRTSYNTIAGKHVTGGTPFRKNFAGVGFSYDAVRDAFIPPKPSTIATLDEDACIWVDS